MSGRSAAGRSPQLQVVPHQSWSRYWNNPDKQIQSGDHAGGISNPRAIQTTGGTTQNSCTNSAPIAALNPDDLDAVGEEVPVEEVDEGDGEVEAQKLPWLPCPPHARWA